MLLPKLERAKQRSSAAVSEDIVRHIGLLSYLETCVSMRAPLIAVMCELCTHVLYGMPGLQAGLPSSTGATIETAASLIGDRGLDPIIVWQAWFQAQSFASSAALGVACEVVCCARPPWQL